MAKVVTELDIELAKWNAKTAQIKADMKAVSAAAKKEQLGGNLFGDIGGQLAAFASGGLALSGIKQMLADVDDLADAATKLGETPETLQRVGVAAELSGTSVEGLANAMLKLERALGDVENEKGRDALERLGLSGEKLMALPLDQKILALSAAFQRARDEGHGLADLQALMGRSASELIPLLTSTGEELREMFGGVSVLANDAVFQMAALNDQIDLIAANSSTWLKEQIVGFNDFIAAATAAGMEIAGIEGAMQALRDIEAERKQASERKVSRLAETRASRAAALAPDAFSAYDDKKAKEENQRAKRIADLQREIEKNRIEMLPDDEQIAALGEKLKAVFAKLKNEVDPFGATDGSLKELMGTVAALKADNPALQGALELVKEAQETQQQINSLRERGQKTQAETVRSAAVPGSVAAAINTIFGRSANELVLDETKRQTQVLERIDKGIQKLAGKDPGLFDDDPEFSFP